MKKNSLSIESIVKEKCPTLELGCIQCKVEIVEDYPELLTFIDSELSILQKKIKIEDIAQLPTIQSSRKGYKALGKDPARYRLSAEALLRRVIKGKGLYHINNVVDLLNLVSAKSGYSIGGYDVNKINGNIKLGIGQKEEPYQAIGRGELNIEYLPIFRDDLGAFGSPTSDSTRTMVTPQTTHFLMLIFNFGKHTNLNEVMEEASDWFMKFANAEIIEQHIIS